MSVLGIVGAPNMASGRFRVAQYVTILNSRAIDLTVRYGQPTPWSHRGPSWARKPLIVARWAFRAAAFAPAILESRTTHVTLLSRALLPGVPGLEAAISSPLVLDVDDAVWLSRPMGETAARQNARRARAVVAGNEYIAHWYSQFCDDVTIIPTCVDVERFFPSQKEGSRFVIGWTGSSATSIYLEQLDGELGVFLQEKSDALLRVVSDRAPVLPSCPSKQVEWIPWSPQVEAQAVRSFSVGLMPLPDTPWTRGKCAFKIIQYLASGVPALASPTGANRDVLARADVGWLVERPGDWLMALRECYSNNSIVRQRGAEGRRLATNWYSIQRQAPRLESVLRAAASPNVSELGDR